MSHQTVRSPVKARRHVLILPLIDQYRDKIDAFMQQYEIQPNGCWKWTGRTLVDKRCESGEYGSISLNKNTRLLVHRLSYAYHYGVDPEALVVRHKCDFGLCMNPEHLQLGTNNDNMRDMKDRGRSTHGVKAYHAKLTEAEVMYIVSLLPSYSDTEIAIRIKGKVSTTAIRSIRHGKTWNRLTGITPKDKAA